MKRLPKAKRNQLILVIFGTMTLIGLVYFLLISPQIQENHKLVADTSSDAAKLQQIQNTLKQTDATTKIASEISAQLSQSETDVATGDLFAWTYNTFRQFKAGYHVDIPTIGQPVQSVENLLPNFPYKQITFTLSGTGFYQDIGKFVSDLENKFPHMRVINLALQPSGGSGLDAEKLSFRLDVVALVKPNT